MEMVSYRSFLKDALTIVLFTGSCQQYGHSCLGGHGKRDGSDVDVQNALLKNPAAARYNNLLREIMARRNLGPQAFIPNSDWSRYQDSQELLEKKSIDYSAV